MREVLVEFNYRYRGASAVTEGAQGSAMSFVPDALRPPTYFRGRVRDALGFREAMSALHDVVVSDLTFQPKDRTKYLAWRAQQADLDLVAVARDRVDNAREMEQVRAELAPLEAQAHKARSAFYEARGRYYKYLYEHDKELWFKLDPVITVHPDQLFFECFSRDESSYGRLAASYEGFDEVGERAFGTTNVDYSDGLYGEFQKLRSYKHTSLDVDPAGFGVATSGEDAHREVKIDVPDSWVRGFLQVSSSMTLPTTVVDLHPMDIHNVCLVLRRNKELFGPRSLRYRLRPGEPVVIVVDPWGIEVRCPRSIYQGPTATEIRVWGRRRLHILERLLPRARRVRVHLLGTGLPSFYLVDLGQLSFTLGLSGWTHNNWSAASNFDLMATREQVDDSTRQSVFAGLGKHWLSTPAALAQELGLSEPVVSSALSGWVQAGRAIYDLEKGVYRKRELSREPLPAEKLRFASEREAEAAHILHHGKIALDEVTTREGNTRMAGRVEHRGRLSTTMLVLDPDRRLVDGECTCDHYVRNRLHRGPCDHMLALRAAERRGISDTIELRDVRRVEPPVRSTASATSVGTSPASARPVSVASAGQTGRRTSSAPLAREPSFWQRVVAFFQRIVAALTGKPALPPPPLTPEERLRRAVLELAAHLTVSDQPALLAELASVYRRHDLENARLFALVAAVKTSAHVQGALNDQTIIAILRRALA
jgi:predicted nucleic acid-binding Zn finger protein